VDLGTRFRRLDVPLREGPADLSAAKSDSEVAETVEAPAGIQRPVADPPRRGPSHRADRPPPAGKNGLLIATPKPGTLRANS